MSSIIISGSDNKYFSLLYNLFDNLKKKNILKKKTSYNITQRKEDY